MHVPKIELRAHTYQYTTEKKIQVINKHSYHFEVTDK